MRLLGLEPSWGVCWQSPDGPQGLLLLSVPEYPDLESTAVELRQKLLPCHLDFYL